MKRSMLPYLLCAALALSLAACGGGSAASPDPSAQAAFAGEWIVYAACKNDKAVPYEDFSWSTLYELKADGSFTSQHASTAASGTWTGKSDGSAALKSSSGTKYTLTPDAAGGTAMLHESGGGTVCAARTDSSIGRAAKKERDSVLENTSEVNGETQRTFMAWCSVSTENGQSYLDTDEVVWVSGSDADALALFGIDPAGVSDDYALYDPDEETFSYSFADDASFLVYLDGVKKGANRSGFITVVKNSGKILARVTTLGESVTAVAQIYIP